MSKTMQLTFIFSLLVLLLVVAMMSGLIQSDRWRITQLEVAAEYNRITPEQLRLMVAKTPERSFFRLDAEQVKSNIESMPWVRYAHVVKQWPETLRITIKEHQAIAIWNGNDLLNQSGEVFQVDAVDHLNALPRLYGLNKDSAETLDNFTRFNQLLKPVGHEIRQARVNERGDWQLILRNGLEVLLGSEKHEARILLLAETWDQLLQTANRLPERVDLRYSNGYVVRWREQEEVTDKKMSFETRDVG
ncbi:cell division protein FtsQ/DivIB [Marinicella sp. S1101]|uniref:cell division protein FtsQ/DivIB n=1 Tax=Marinicella marina TaxID=2996016 RepID=UPI0022609257|nr:cell division protein FtsQ/DivIB [Marinicella marina]MCX7553886.1 cell division protein FtsQ/DivIB [Marinicella marina]MDJ1140378.1 cell division protein FtsQ/DivIB [Marinicella marina]